MRDDELKWQPVPSLKSEKVNDLFKSLYGVDRKTAITNRTCVSCGVEELTENSFRDDIALREFHISGLCQTCQDKIFGIEELMEK